MADKRQLMAIMFTDIRGFSTMMGQDEATTVRVVREHREVVRDALARHGGREMRTVGDAFLVLFESAVQAVVAAIDIQERMADRNRGVSTKEQVWMRIGIHLGEVVLGEDGELYGDAVNIAARVEPHAPPGGVCVTDAVVVQVKKHIDRPWIQLGAVRLKNIDDAPDLFALRIGDAPALPKTASRRARWAALAVAVAGLLLGGALGVRRENLRTSVSAIPEVRALYDEATADLAFGDMPAARSAILEAAKRDPSAWRVLWAESTISPEQTEASDLLERAVRLAPEGADGDIVRLTQRSFQEGDSPPLAVAWDAWGVAHPDDTWGQLVRASLYPAHMMQGLDVSEGKPHDHGPLIQMRAFVALHPEHIMGRMTLAVLEQGDRHPDAAKAQIDEALRRCVRCAGVHQVAGDLLLERRDWKGAEDHYRMAVELDPGLPGNREHLADIAAYLGDEPERLRRTEALMADDTPNWLRAGFAVGHGSLLASLGRRADGFALIERGLALTAGTDALAGIGALQLEAETENAYGDYVAARAAIERLRTALVQPEVPGRARDSTLVWALLEEADIAWNEGSAAVVGDVEQRLQAMPPERFAETSQEDAVRMVEMKRLSLAGDLEGALALARRPAPGCGRDRTEARVSALAGRPDDALAAWRRAWDGLDCHDNFVVVEASLVLAEDALSRGDRAAAAAYEARAHERWPHPDADLPFAQRMAAVDALLGSGVGVP